MKYKLTMWYNAELDSAALDGLTRSFSIWNDDSLTLMCNCSKNVTDVLLDPVNNINCNVIVKTKNALDEKDKDIIVDTMNKLVIGILNESLARLTEISRALQMTKNDNVYMLRDIVNKNFVLIEGD